MVTVTRNRPRRPAPAWHAKFLAMLPTIVQHARIAFRHRDTDAREEAVQEVVCNACQAVARLAELGKLDLAYASVLARYGVAQVKDGRKVGNKLNCCDVLSPYCQRVKNITVERLDQFNCDESTWQEAVVQDTRTAPVSEIVAFRCDFADWLRHLSRRDSKVAQFLAVGNRTSEAARKFNVCEGRISQLRHELAESWNEFTGAEPDDTAVVPA